MPSEDAIQALDMSCRNCGHPVVCHEPIVKWFKPTRLRCNMLLNIRKFDMESRVLTESPQRCPCDCSAQRLAVEPSNSAHGPERCAEEYCTELAPCPTHYAAHPLNRRRRTDRPVHHHARS